MNKMYYIWEAAKIMFTSLSVFDTTIYLLLLLATVYVAWKKPGKISAIGKIIVVMTLFCVIKDVNILLNEVFVKSPSYCLPSYEVSEIIHRIRSEFPEYREVSWSNFEHVMVYDLARVAGSVVIGCLTYIINNIIYIIRTPRI